MTASNPFYTGPNAPTTSSTNFYANPTMLSPSTLGQPGASGSTVDPAFTLFGSGNLNFTAPGDSNTSPGSVNNPNTYSLGSQETTYGGPGPINPFANNGTTDPAPPPSLPQPSSTPVPRLPNLYTGGAPTSSAATSDLGQLPASTLSQPQSSTSTPQTGPLSGPGYNEQWYQENGNNLNGPTNSQTLFDEGMSGSNPFYQDAVSETNKGINAAENARGDWNSSAALGSIGMADANLYGQQALGLTTLGGTADTQNTSQFNAGSNASATAQNSTQNRIGGDITANMNLSTDQANLVDNFYQMAQTGQLTTDMAGIEAQLAASGVDAATAQALTNDILTAGGVVAKVASK